MQPILPVEPSASIPHQRWVNRHPFLTLLIGVLVVFLVLGYSGSQTSNDSAAGTGQSAPAASQPRPSASQAIYVDPRELGADPDRFKGQNVFLQGQALNVEQNSDYTWVQVMAQVRGKDSFTTEPIVVEVRPKDSVILKGDCYKFYGVVAGKTQIKVLLTGAVNDIAGVAGYQTERLQEDSFGFCPVP